MLAVKLKGLRVDEGDHDVAGATGHGQSLVVVRQPARVHEHPALLGVRYGAVVPDETAAAAL
jgi:hypothetical protein